MKLIFCRHGETSWNLQGRLQGHLDSRLTEAGYAQSQSLGQTLSAYRPELIVSSDLGRAVTTAEQANLSLNLPLLTQPLLRERSFGQLQGKLAGQERRWWQAYKQRFQGDELHIPGAESASAVQLRVLAFLDWVDRCPAETLMVVSHGEWLRIMQNTLADLPPWSEQLPLPGNCEILSLTTAQSAG